MTDLWFEQELDPPRRRGGTLYASRPGVVRAVMRSEASTAFTLEDRARELLGDYGMLAGGIGAMMLAERVEVSPELERWATAPGMPAVQLGGWGPTLIAIDGVPHLAMSRTFGNLRVFATTLLMDDRERPEYFTTRDDLTILAPASESVVRLVHRDDLPAHDWDQTPRTEQAPVIDGELIVTVTDAPPPDTLRFD